MEHSDDGMEHAGDGVDMSKCPYMACIPKIWEMCERLEEPEYESNMELFKKALDVVMSAAHMVGGCPAIDMSYHEEHGRTLLITFVYGAVAVDVTVEQYHQGARGSVCGRPLLRHGKVDDVFYWANGACDVARAIEPERA